MYVVRTYSQDGVSEFLQRNANLEFLTLSEARAVARSLRAMFPSLRVEVLAYRARRIVTPLKIQTAHARGPRQTRRR